MGLLTTVKPPALRERHDYVAYFPIQAEQEKTRGRPRRYGDKIALMEVFDHRHLFTTVTCQLYGQAEEVAITALDLIWKPTGGLIRFVFVHTRLGPLVLMSRRRTDIAVTCNKTPLKPCNSMVHVSELRSCLMS